MQELSAPRLLLDYSAPCRVPCHALLEVALTAFASLVCRLRPVAEESLGFRSRRRHHQDGFCLCRVLASRHLCRAGYRALLPVGVWCPRTSFALGLTIGDAAIWRRRGPAEGL